MIGSILLLACIVLIGFGGATNEVEVEFEEKEN